MSREKNKRPIPPEAPPVVTKPAPAPVVTKPEPKPAPKPEPKPEPAPVVIKPEPAPAPVVHRPIPAPVAVKPLPAPLPAPVPVSKMPALVASIGQQLGAERLMGLMVCTMYVRVYRSDAVVLDAWLPQALAALSAGFDADRVEVYAR